MAKTCLLVSLVQTLRLEDFRSPQESDRSLFQNQPTTKKHDKHNNLHPNLYPRTRHTRGRSSDRLNV
ncbi:MAG: hypothetical protein F6K39_05550 [Okeania sp. SIO3B3]|nr:hypothetical protein [Okeania sp. SIO3B3]